MEDKKKSGPLNPPKAKVLPCHRNELTKLSLPDIPKEGMMVCSYNKLTKLSLPAIQEKERVYPDATTRKEMREFFNIAREQDGWRRREETRRRKEEEEKNKEDRMCSMM